MLKTAVLALKLLLESPACPQSRQQRHAHCFSDSAAVLTRAAMTNTTVICVHEHLLSLLQ
jgi:hypothetical protein